MSGSMIEEIVQGISTAVTMCLIFCWMSKVYGRVSDRRRLVAGYLISTGLILAVNHLQIPLLNFVYYGIQINAIAVLIFGKKLKESFLYNTIYMFMALFSDTLSVLLWTVVTDNGYEIVSENALYLSLSCIFNVFVMYFFYRMFVLIVEKNELKKMRISQFLIQFIFNAFAFLIIRIFSLRMETQKDGIVLFFIILAFLIMNFLLAYMIYSVMQAYHDQYEWSMMKQQSRMQLEHYRALSDKYEEARKVIHDVKKHLNALEMMQEINPDKAGEYRAMIVEQVESLVGEIKCSHPMLGVVLNQKLREAREKHIVVEAEIMDIPVEFMSDIDITSLFANLLDNAIEATEILEESQRKISVTLGRMNDFIIISVKNTFDGRVKKDKGRYLSSKEGHAGLGMSIICDIIEKYGGNRTVEIRDNVFQTEIVFSRT